MSIENQLLPILFLLIAVIAGLWSANSTQRTKGGRQ